MMQELSARWYFANECPRIGGGIRGVKITIGRRHVRFVEYASGRRGKIPIEVFEKLRPNRLLEEVPVPRKRFIAKGVRRGKA